MAGAKVMVGVSVSGPLADGSARQLIREWLDESKRATADEAVRLLKSVTMDRSKRGTGRYQSEIRTQLIRFNDVVIDDPVIYGPWLEGTSRRNESTRFKGYHLWRRSRQKIRAQAGDIARAKLPPYLERIGGVR